MTALSPTVRQGILGSGAVGRQPGTADVWTLSNGRFTTRLSPDGSGYAEFLGKAVTRPSSRPFRQSRGFYVYLRDTQTGVFWSSTFQPTLIGPTVVGGITTASHMELTHEVDDIVVNTRIWMLSGFDAELRTCRITNVGSISRCIELTSYAELVLGDAAADAGHLAFSKLFIETGYCPDRSILWGRRRPRSAEQKCISAAHLCLGEAGGQWGPLSGFETDRALFIRRGRSLVSPRAMVGREQLSGTVGSVLDPIFSLRRCVEVGPANSAEVTWALVAAADQADLWPHIDELRSSYTSTAVPGANNRSYVRVDSDLPHAGRVSSHITSAVAVDGQRVADSASGANGTHDHSLGRGELAMRAKRLRGGGHTGTPAAAEQLQFFNGIGGFSTDGTEYVVRLRTDDHGTLILPPMPWANVIANPQAGFIVTETGASCTWAGNSRENRLTPWSNDPISDPHAEAFYLRDEDRHCYWSPLPGPAPHVADYEVRHGLGYTRFRHESEELLQIVTQFVPRDDPVKISLWELTNLSDQPRNLTLIAYHRWDLTGGADPNDQPIEVWVDRHTNSIFARNKQRAEYTDCVAISCLATATEGALIDHCVDAAVFIGPHGSISAPAAVCEQSSFPTSSEASIEPCAASQLHIQLSAGESFQCVCLLGEAPIAEEADELIRRYKSFADCQQALENVRQFWSNLRSAVQIETPSVALNLMVNSWLPYQNLSGRLRGRSSLYQSGGAFGFRDQLQDAAALVYHRPELTRQQILLHAAHQFVEGDVLHWWHPPASRGVRTRFSDDLLWLPLLAAEYASTTGDTAIWDESIRFLQAAPLAAGEMEKLVTPAESGTSGTLYEHCCRALDRSLPVGAHGLPLIGCGDWNDGMNRIGVEGRGESVWLGFFLYSIFKMLIPVCQQRGDDARANRYREHGDQLQHALNDAGWDGEWYRRAYFDNGHPLGSRQNAECRIDALVQAWSILSGIAPADRAEQAVRAVDSELVCPEGGIIRLLAPPLDKMPDDPGYIKGYLPGIRENGGQYTHGVLWFIRALAELGKGTRAVELLDMLCPVNHARSAEQVATYQVEPFVVAADVYGVPPHVGRGGWTWYTGSAGWMFRVAVESILGLGIENGDTLVLNPCISRDWPSCHLRLRLPAFRRGDEPTVYQIRVENPNRRETGVSRAIVDGIEIPITDGAARVPIQRDGAQHDVQLQL